MIENHHTEIEQTTFAGQQPFNQKVEQSASDIERARLQKIEDENKPKKPWFKNKKTILILVAVILGLLFLLLILMPKKEQLPGVVEPTPTPEAQAPNYMIERIRRLQAELKAADPTKTDIIFPPVDMEIELDPAE
jgi:hypothetical protein